MNTLLDQAVAHIKAGDLENGKQLLIQVLQQNPKDENAWLWMSRCVPTAEQKKECFKRALAINPSNEMARKALEKLSLSVTPPVQSPTPAYISSTKETAVPTTTRPSIEKIASTVEQPLKQKQQTINKNSISRNVRPQKKKGVSPKIWLPMVLALITCCGSVVAAFVGSDAVKTIVTGIIPRPDNFTISVHVADKSGSAISSAKVLFFYPAGSLSQYTDSNGVSTFDVSNAGQGNLRVIVETDNYQIFEKQVVYPIETTIDVRLSEKQGSNENVILRAVTDGGNAPIAGIDIVVTLDGNLYHQATDSDGFALFELPFPDEGQIDTQISVNAQGYGIENQFSTLTPGKLQYILLTPNSLSVSIPDVPLAPRPSPQSTTNQNIDTSGAVIGSGVEVSQQSGGNGLKVIFLTADFKPADGYFIVYEQKTDVTEGLLKGNQIDGKSINQQGELFFEINEGVYVICQSSYIGYDWTDLGCVYNIQIASGKQTIVTFQTGQIKFTVVDAIGNTVTGYWWEILTQTQGVTGKPVSGERVWSGTTDKTGVASVQLTPGLYVIDYKLLAGYKWGQKPTDRDGISNTPVKKGETTQITITLGQIAIELRDTTGQPDTGNCLDIFTQKNDINGKQIIDQQVGSVCTDNGGFATYNLTEGMYAVKINGNVLYNVPINWGVITQTDGTTFQQIK